MTDLLVDLRIDSLAGLVPEIVRRDCARAADSIEQMRGLLRDCAEHFKTLREANVFVWPNHPLNPEARIAEMLRETQE